MKIETFLAFLNLISFSSSFSTPRSAASSNRGHSRLQMSRTTEDITDSQTQINHMSEIINALTSENKKLKSDALESVQLDSIRYPSLPAWYNDLKTTEDCCVVDKSVREWHDESWRRTAGGFSGTDFVHSRTRAPVRILEYLIIKRANLDKDHTKDVSEGLFYPSLVGPAYFSSAAESHKGLCHGGSMCALMDDAVGWMGFCISGKPREWTGYTVQIDTSLKKSVAVGSVLKLEAWVERREGARKIWICAKLSDPFDGTLHCTARGLFLTSPEALLPDESNSSINEGTNKKSKL